MKNEERAIVLTVESRPYDFNGLKGVSHKVRLSILGEVYAIKVSESQVQELKPLEGDEISVVLKFSSPKERLVCNLESFKTL